MANGIPKKNARIEGDSGLGGPVRMQFFIIFIAFQGEGRHARKAATCSTVGSPMDPLHSYSEASFFRVCGKFQGVSWQIRKYPRFSQGAPPSYQPHFRPEALLFVFFAYMKGFSSFRAIPGNFSSARAARVVTHEVMGLSQFVGHFWPTFWDTFWSLPGSRFGGDLLDRA